MVEKTMEEIVFESAVHALVRDYFTAWNSRNYDDLKRSLHADVLLTDWLQIVSGSENVTNANLAIHKKYPNSSITIIDFAVCKGPKVMAQIQITLSEEEVLNVVDVFTIWDNQITSIQAYKL